MLRYVAIGRRNFTTSPVPLFSRMNWEFYAVTRGAAAPFFSNMEKPILRQRTLWLLKAKTSYGWRGDGKQCLRAAFHFSSVPPPVKQALGTRDFIAVKLTPKECGEVIDLAKSLEVHFRRPNQFSAMHCERALLTLSLMVLKDQKLQASLPYHQRDEDRLERAMAWYSIHLARNPLVEEVAEAVHMSGANLRLICKKLRGVSPRRLMKQIQIERASEILANTDDKLVQVARECGFQSVEDFCRVFKREKGVSADVWRRYT
ncbi:MAG: helix-turn-helix transcriptional regulator [Chthoniobacterales bacterium]|nr:helix-turn-helix transcriptional regulator [Chthoniobacterales bacterium]